MNYPRVTIYSTDPNGRFTESEIDFTLEMGKIEMKFFSGQETYYLKQFLMMNPN